MDFESLTYKQAMQIHDDLIALEENECWKRTGLWAGDLNMPEWAHLLMAHLGCVLFDQKVYLIAWRAVARSAIGRLKLFNELFENDPCESKSGAEVKKG